MTRRRSGWSVARQVLLLQVLVVIAVVVGAAALAVADARSGQLDNARSRSIDVAVAVADSPTVLEALRTPHPSDTIEPYAERVRIDTGTDFVVVMALDRTRYSHPNPALIGGHFVGDLGAAPRGHVFTQEHAGSLGRSMRAVVPVFADPVGGTAAGRRVVALVSVGITLSRIDAALQRQLLQIVGGGLVVLLAGGAGSWVIGRRLRRQTRGLGAPELARMYDYYDAVLHAVREGLLLLDERGVVVLANDEALRLLGLDEDVVARPLADLPLPAVLLEDLDTGATGPDVLHLVGDNVLVVNQAPARLGERRVGSVVTLRDHTELQAVSGELDTARGLADTLRSQTHEAANRLHTVVSLIELDRPRDALAFATDELHAAQALTDHVVGAIREPVVAALLLGKSAQADERGIELRLEEDSHVEGCPLGHRELVTVLGNLVDNAFDAVQDGPHREVAVRLVSTPTTLALDVSDSGPGLDRARAEQAFERGWSTKRGDDDLGRGLGLALVAQVVRRHGGSVQVDRSPLGGAEFAVRIPAEGVRD
jgi:sensor histidine kinase regulating citrate/malate metabolism